MISSDKLKRWINLLVFGTVGLIIFSVLLTFSLEQHYSDYKLLNVEDHVDGQVTSIRKYQDTTYVVINDSKYVLSPAENQSYSPRNLTEFLKEGDFVSKNAKSDSLTVTRDDENYLFVLNRLINHEVTIQMNESIQSIIQRLDLQPHPEGGYFKETYRSDGSIPAGDLPEGFSGARNFSTSIYYLLVSKKPSTFHKINQDEIWHFYDGSPIELHTISESGEHQKYLIGRDFEKGQVPQLVVPAHHWFASRVIESDSYSLVGCTVAPGFNFDDFELAKRSELLQKFPQHDELIVDFTTDD